MNSIALQESKNHTVATRLCNFEYLLLTDFAKQLGITRSELLRKMAIYVLQANWSSLGGHPKTGHVWPLQNRPYENDVRTGFSTLSISSNATKRFDS